MTPKRWRQIKAILAEALERPADARHDFLAAACAGDDEARREVESLLEYDALSADFLDDSIFSFSKSLAEGARQTFVGQRFGKYEIIDELGAGGMGAVFLAERADGEFRQKVAVKIIKRGMDSQTVIRRFLNERQILAALEHPNIARLIDGGTTDDGLPYFVMEYVEGETILEFARRRNLDVEQRLDLFREVCAAVSFAHRNLVVHRDLKPSNILVNGEGKPKLLDFGIAKPFRAEISDKTATQHFAFTPEYASPEQMMGGRLTTATDIYSLGVILYELLTGTRPFSFEGKNFGQIVQSVTRTEPPRPSVRIADSAETGSRDEKNIGVKSGSKTRISNPKTLRGDLDNIVLKSLKSEPERRYETVEQFSEDVRRFLKGLPVLARRDTVLYRAEKFARRSPLVVGAAALSFLILVGGSAAVSWQAGIADLERARAERRFADVRRLANSFIFEIDEEIERSPVKARELLARRAVEYLDNLAREAEGDLELQSELAAAYEKIGNVQSELYRSSLGKTSDALLSHQKALLIRERLFAAEPQKIVRGIDLAASQARLGDVYSMSGRIGEARASYAEAIRLGERLLALDAGDPKIRRSQAQNYSRLGQSVLRSGSLGAALENYEKALAIIRGLLAERPDDARLRHSIGVYNSYIGYAKLEMGEFDEAGRRYHEALQIARGIWETDKNNKSYRSNIGIAHLWFGVALREAGKIGESFSHLQKALEIQQAIFRADAANLGEQNSLADCHLEYAMALAKGGRANAAIENYRQAIENYSAVRRADEQNLAARRQIAFTERHLANAVLQNGDLAEASRIYRRALAEFQALTAADPDNIEWQHDAAICQLQIGEILLKKGERDAAFSYFIEARSKLEILVRKSPENATKRRNLEAVRSRLAEERKTTPKSAFVSRIY